MSDQTKETRERVQALVREVLKNVPAGTDSEPDHVVVNSLQEKFAREWDRDESSKQLITEDDLRGLDEGARVRVADNAKFTPLASDIVAERRLQLIRKQSRHDSIKVKSVAIGADHGGFHVKEELKQFLNGLGVQVRDFGTNSTDAVDYPDFAHAVARSVGEGHVDVGIIVDGAGIGSAMAANKVPGVRAAACYNAALAKNSREHNGANVLTLGSGQNSIDEIKQIVEAWISTELTEERHKKRVNKINTIETQYKK
ncbi:MAG TPA: ribose 5-phosphate isomerase B [Pyrinomonadaceae bacterium]|nr:ribose 5-phosphate isomerase B [Pyrinomonadaceae bacterium]